MDRILKELGDLYEFNRKIQEFKFVQKDEKSETVNKDSTIKGPYRKSVDGE